MFKHRIMKGIAAIDLCLVLSLGAAVYVRYNEHQHLRRYKTVIGKITRSEVVASTTQRDGRPTTSYRAAIRYEYGVDGRQLHGARVRWNDLFQIGWSASRAKADVQRYRRGSLVPVHYDPDRPSQAFLDLDYTNDFIVLTIALAVVSFAIGLLSRAIGRARERPRP